MVAKKQDTSHLRLELSCIEYGGITSIYTGVDIILSGTILISCLRWCPICSGVFDFFFFFCFVWCGVGLG